MKTPGRIIITVGLVSALVILLAFSVFIRSSRNFFFNYYQQDLDNYSSVFKKAVEMADAYTKIYERTVAEDLYHRLSSISDELKDTPREKITPETLNRLRGEHDLYGISIFARDWEGIFVSSSTIPEEIGERTKAWGYWNEAFENLFDGKKPVIKGGFSHSNYWIGPRSKSHQVSGYFRYAYYYNRAQDYLINGILEDNLVYEDNVINMLDDFFGHLGTDVSYIEAITLIDLKAWEKASQNDYKNPVDIAFLYGNLEKNILIQSGLSPEDLYAIDENRSVPIKYGGKDKTLFMIPAGEKAKPYLIAILINDEEARAFVRRTLYNYAMLLILTLVVLVGGIYVIVLRYRSLLTFQAERNREIERFTRNIAMLPEMMYRCKIQEGELFLTYNYGKSMDEDHKISLECIYRPMKDFFTADYVDGFKELVEPVFQGQARSFEISSQGTIYEHFTSPVFDDDGRIREIIGIANNITNRKLREEESKYFSRHDHLTGLVNRRFFEESSIDLLNNDSQGHYGLLIIDLDGFKSINDNFSHLAGDQVLKEAADRIRNTIHAQSPRAIVARMGGDEFAACIPYGETEEISRVAQDLIQAVSQPMVLQNSDRQVAVGMSIGISLYDQDSPVYDRLLYYADLAMYQAKMTGGRSFAFFSRSMLPC